MPLLMLLVLLLVPPSAAAEVVLPAGFVAHAYVTGEGFDGASARAGSGIPSASTLGFDRAGVLYLGRTGRRYMGGEVDDLMTIYRIPAGGARLTPESEARYFYGPPLPSPQVTAIGGGQDLFVTTFDRDRKVGVLYRIVDGRAELVAGGTPPPGALPVLTQPEGAAIDRAGNIYVADRARNVVVRLDAAGRVLDPRWVGVTRPRLLAVDEKNQLWIGSDGDAEAPWQRSPGEIWRVSPEGVPTVVARGPLAAGLALGPQGRLFAADRNAGKVFFLTAEGKLAEFATFTEGDAPRGLGFAPATPETRRLGIAGDLFVIVIRRGAWPVNEVIRISGPFDALGRE